MRGTKTKRLRREAQGRRPKPGRKLGGADWRAGADPELLQTMRDEHAALFEEPKSEVEELVDDLEAAGLQVDRAARTIELEPVVHGTTTGRIEHGLKVGDKIVTIGPDGDAVEATVTEVVEADGLDDLGIVALRKAAKPYKIPGAWTMKSAELRAAIRAARAQ